MNKDIKRTIIKLIGENHIKFNGTKDFPQYDFTATNVQNGEKTNIIIQGNKQYCELLIDYKTFATTKKPDDNKDIWDLFNAIESEYNRQDNTLTRAEFEKKMLVKLQGLIKNNQR